MPWVQQVTGGTSDERVRLAELRETPLSVDEVLDAVRDARAGGIGLFVGTVREHDRDHGVQALDYSAHPSAQDLLRQTAEKVLREDITAIAVTHRVGHLEIGDAAVVVAVSAAHRGPALEVCREMIDTLKAIVPIWKHQQFADGSDEWVGLP